MVNPRTYLVDKQEKVSITRVQMSYETHEVNYFSNPFLGTSNTPSMPRAQIWSKWLLYMCAYTRNNRRTMVLIVSRKFLGKGTPDIQRGINRYQVVLWTQIKKNTKKFTHQSYLEKYSHHREGFVPSSSMHRRIPVQEVSLDVWTSRRPPKDIHNCA